MSSTVASELFSQFVQFVENESPIGNGSVTVEDVRQAIRKDRLTEISVWSCKELDDVEGEVVCYSDTTEVASILSPDSRVLQAAACATTEGTD